MLDGVFFFSLVIAECLMTFVCFLPGDVAVQVGRPASGHEVHDAGCQLVVQGQERHGQVRQGHEAQGLHREDPDGLHKEAQQLRQTYQAGLYQCISFPPPL